MTRRYSTTSVQTTLAVGISSTATTATVTSGTASALIGGISLTSGNVDQFAIAIDHDTANEEIVWVTGVTTDTLTIVRGRAGTSNVAHSAGASVKHVLTGEDLTYLVTGVESGVTLTGTQTLTNKTLTAPTIASIVNTGTLTLPTTTDTLVGKTTADTLTNKTLLSAKEPFYIGSLAAPTATTNIDVLTTPIQYYQNNNSTNFTINVRGNGSTTLNSVLAVGESITVVMVTKNGSTPYYANAFTIDGTSVTPKWLGIVPGGGNANSTDVYSYAIMKLAANSYYVLASLTRFV